MVHSPLWNASAADLEFLHGTFGPNERGKPLDA